MTRYQMPFGNPDLVDGFGSELYPRTRPHRGLDFAQPVGTPIPVVASGTIVDKSESGELGYYTVVQHADGMFTGYCHSRQPSPIALGAAVTRGQVINTVGDLGFVTGPHLHLTLSTSPSGIYEGQVQDPYPYIQARLNDPETPITPPEEEDMPTKFESTRSIATTLAKKTWAEIEAPNSAAQFTNLVYNDGATATNIAELVGSKSDFDINMYLYIRNLPAGEFVNVRLAYQNRTTGAYSGLTSTTITGSTSGRVRGLYSAHASLNQYTHRLIAQANASTTGVVIDLWRVEGFAF